MQVTGNTEKLYSFNNFRANNLCVFKIIMIFNVSVLTDLSDYQCPLLLPQQHQLLLQFLLQCAQHQSLLHKLLQQRLSPSPSACDCTGSCALTALSATAYTDSAEQSDEERVGEIQRLSYCVLFSV